ncbi:MAG TPA: DUF4288 domain-containing protein [Gemmatimonadales bacterium]|nr:DUF4288 domain-containing protein [Gemmatimonadales bacterium]
MIASSRNLWYWAWLVQMTVPKRGRPGSGDAHVWRNLVLVQARSADEALAKAEAIGKSASGDAEGALLLDGQPAKSVFVGIADAGLVDFRLSDGVEVMFQMERQTARHARGLARARPSLIARLKHEAAQLRASAAPAGRSLRLRGTGSSRPARAARA